MEYDQELKLKSDAEIVKLVSNDRNAFLLLVNKYQAPILRYLSRIGIRESDDRDDVLQNTFIKAYVNINSYDTSLPFNSWIYRIAHNEAINHIRSRKRFSNSVSIEIDEEDFPALEKIIFENDSMEETNQSINAEHLKKAINKLDSKYKDVLVLRYFEERDYDDISHILEIPSGSVATLIHRAKKILKDELKHLK